jgi:triacylglycerol lipase
LTDVNVVLIQGPFDGRVHAGFYLALESVWKDLLKALRESQTHAQSLWFTGHSLGGALASLAVARLLAERRSGWCYRAGAKAKACPAGAR